MIDELRRLMEKAKTARAVYRGVPGPEERKAARGLLDAYDSLGRASLEALPPSSLASKRRRRWWR